MCVHWGELMQHFDQAYKSSWQLGMDQPIVSQLLCGSQRGQAHALSYGVRLVEVRRMSKHS